MKYLLFILLLVGIILTAGCVGGNQNSVVKPTQTATAISTDQIVGIWQWTTADGSKLYTFNFFADGRYSFTDSSDPNTQPGTWSKVRENEYLISYTGGKTQDVLLNPATETFTIPEFSQVIAYRQGAKMPTSTPTVARSQDPIIGVWRCSDSSGYDHRYRFNADHTFVESFSLGGTGGTDIFKGSWRSEGRNSYIAVDDEFYQPETIVYSPSRNIIYSKDIPTFVLSPYAGDVEAAT